MNQLDATATPMTECFGSTADLTPFDAVPNNVPLDQMNPALKEIKEARQRRDALASSHLPLSKPDQCPESLLNHILWRAQMGVKAPYPQWAISEQGDD
jgi:hypothetical protein